MTHVTKILVIPSPPGLMYVKITKNMPQSSGGKCVRSDYKPPLKILSPNYEFQGFLSDN